MDDESSETTPAEQDGGSVPEPRRLPKLSDIPVDPNLGGSGAKNIGPAGNPLEFLKDLIERIRE